MSHLADDIPPPTGKELEKLMSRPVIKQTDMANEMQQECIEVITMSLDKYLQSANYEAAAVLIKNQLDKKFGLTWHCAIGEGFGFDVTTQHRYLMYVFYGKVGVVCYKC